nr:glycosyltransferase family 2 protein [Ancylobacter tetraedralis]
MVRRIEAQYATSERVAALHTEIYELRVALQREARRVDYALAELEGLASLRDEFHQARRTEEYRRAFTDPEPLVSVCVTTYNRSSLLIDRCITSLREQSYRNLQIIVSGDHCTDDTAERLAKVGDPRIEFYNLDRRMPYPPPGKERWLVAGSHAGNLGRSRVKGQFVTHLDEDDTFDQRRIEIVLAAAQQNEADFVWHKFWYQQMDTSWLEWGNGKLELGQVGLGMIFYHRFFSKLPANVYAYRLDEPGDWNFIRRIMYFRPKLLFIPEALTRYYKYPANDTRQQTIDHEFLD